MLSFATQIFVTSQQHIKTNTTASKTLTQHTTMEQVHSGVKCDGCGRQPLVGIRWKCGNCADYDLCTSCLQSSPHDPTHVFVRIVTPIPQQPTSSPLLSINLYMPNPFNAPPPPYFTPVENVVRAPATCMGHGACPGNAPCVGCNQMVYQGFWCMECLRRRGGACQICGDNLHPDYGKYGFPP